VLTRNWSVAVGRLELLEILVHAGSVTFSKKLRAIVQTFVSTHSEDARAGHRVRCEDFVRLLPRCAAAERSADCAALLEGFWRMVAHANVRRRSPTRSRAPTMCPAGP
jgi:hypothetical protein